MRPDQMSATLEWKLCWHLAKRCWLSARPSTQMFCSHCHRLPLLRPSSQPEGATSEEEAVHLSKEGLPGSHSGSGVVGLNPGVGSVGNAGPLQSREQSERQGKIRVYAEDYIITTGLNVSSSATTTQLQLGWCRQLTAFNLLLLSLATGQSPT